MQRFISPDGIKHNVLLNIPIKVSSPDKFREYKAKLGKPILVYFILSIEGKKWMSWIHSISTIKDKYQTVNIVAQCRDSNDPVEVKKIINKHYPDFQVHVYADKPITECDKNSLYGGQFHDPYCGEYRAFELMYKLAYNDPSQIFAYGHSKGITSFSSFEEATSKPLPNEKERDYFTKYSLNMGMTVLKSVDRAIDAFSMFENVNCCCFSSDGYHERKRLWYNFFFVRGQLLVASGPPVKTHVRHYYEQYYLIHERGTDDLIYNMKSCNCRLYKECKCCFVKSQYTTDDPVCPNIGIWFSNITHRFAPDNLENIVPVKSNRHALKFCLGL
jgi:hypothetical protein